MRRKMICSSAIALTILMSSIGYSQDLLRIEIDFRSGFNETGGLLDDTGLSGLRLTVPVLEDEREGDAQLTISVPTFSGMDNPTLNGSASEALGFGINSGGFDDGFAAFDADFNESATIFFSQDLFIEAIDLQSLDFFGGATDEFRVGDVLINDFQTASNDVFSFVDSANPDGMFLEAGQTLLLEATDGAVAVQTLTVQIPILIGDVNCDGNIDLLDVGPFVDAIIAGVFDPKADINGDGMVDLLDVGPFVTILTGG